MCTCRILFSLNFVLAIVQNLSFVLAKCKISYSFTFPTGVLGSNGFVLKLSSQLFHEQIHAIVNNYCQFIDFRIQVTIASAYLVRTIATFSVHKICTCLGMRRTLTISTAMMLVGSTVTLWFPNTQVVVSAFFIQSFRLGLTGQVYILQIVSQILFK